MGRFPYKHPSQHGGSSIVASRGLADYARKRARSVRVWLAFVLSLTSPGPVTLTLGLASPPCTAWAGEATPQGAPTTLPASQPRSETPGASAPQGAQTASDMPEAAASRGEAAKKMIVTLSASELADLLTSGDLAFAARDLAGSRRFYQIGANAGDSRAALRLAETFDQSFLEIIQLQSAADRERAAYWYRWARGLGSEIAGSMLLRVDPSEAAPSATTPSETGHPRSANQAEIGPGSSESQGGTNLKAQASPATSPAATSPVAVSTTPPAITSDAVDNTKEASRNALETRSATSDAAAVPKQPEATAGPASVPPTDAIAPTNAIAPTDAIAPTNAIAMHEPAVPQANAASVARGASPSHAVPGPGSPPPSTLTSGERANLVARGDSLLGNGDVNAARLFYERAAGAGDSTAALRLGETFDPKFLAQAHLGFVLGDASRAEHWYGIARDLGNPDVQVLLRPSNISEK